MINREHIGALPLDHLFGADTNRGSGRFNFTRHQLTQPFTGLISQHLQPGIDTGHGHLNIFSKELHIIHPEHRDFLRHMNLIEMADFDQAGSQIVLTGEHGDRAREFLDLDQQIALICFPVSEEGVGGLRGKEGIYGVAGSSRILKKYSFAAGSVS
jgi:hypothetical protein